jgi:DNA (cytosine-5)-methyltransferase 1
MRYTCIDSFSGAGGLSLGLIKAGFEVLYSFDNNKDSIATQNLNKKYFNHPAECVDITRLDAGELMKRLGIKRGELTLFAGGPPCQGFSVQRIGQDTDERNTLVMSFMEMVDAISPAFFLMENVPGINGKRGKEILSQALDFIASKGYRIESQVLDAQDYGVPQRRKRMIIIGQRSDLSQPFTFPQTVEEKRTVRGTIGQLPPPPGAGLEHQAIRHHLSDRLSETNLKRIRHLKPGQGRDFLPEELLADCHKVSSSIIGHRNVYGRMHWDDVSPTITARFDSFTRGLFGHPEQDRSISLREGAMLQTFPMDFDFCGNKIDIARQIGNAVPPELARRIGKQLIDALL